MIDIRQLIDFTVYGRHRLEKVEKLPLGSTVSDAISLYGEPIEIEPSEDTPEITQYTFEAGRYHEVVASEWKDRIRSITYWSLKSDPGRDLDCMLEVYRESSVWHVLEPGYWYQRKDGVLKLWCSAIPAIGVAFVDFFRTKAELKTAHSLSQIDELDDVNWVPNDVVKELQRMFVEEGSDALMDFSERSDSISVSPDGRSVLIVRDHHAYDVPKGFMELNKPPDLENGYPSPVVNIFSWGTDGSSWGKITLPRDAKVDKIRFDGDRCLMEIHHTGSGRKFKFERPSSNIARFGLHTISADPHTDERLWKILEQGEAQVQE